MLDILSSGFCSYWLRCIIQGDHIQLSGILVYLLSLMIYMFSIFLDNWESKANYCFKIKSPKMFFERKFSFSPSGMAVELVSIVQKERLGAGIQYPLYCFEGCNISKIKNVVGENNKAWCFTTSTSIGVTIKPKVRPWEVCHTLICFWSFDGLWDAV